MGLSFEEPEPTHEQVFLRDFLDGEVERHLIIQRDDIFIEKSGRARTQKRTYKNRTRKQGHDKERESTIQMVIQSRCQPMVEVSVQKQVSILLTVPFANYRSLKAKGLWVFQMIIT